MGCLEFRSKVRVLYLIIGSSDTEHEADLNAQKQTWLSCLNSRDAYLVLRGSKLSQAKREGNDLFLPVEERYENILQKTILGIGWTNQHIEYEYLVRTNVSTYFRNSEVHNILEKVIGLSIPAYGGYIDYATPPIENVRNRTPYVAGTGIMMNYQASGILARLPLNNYKGCPDDLAMSHFLDSEGIRRSFIARSNFSSTHVLTNAIQVRLKSSHLPHAARLRMLRVHKHEVSKRPTKRLSAWIQAELAEREFIQFSLNELRRVLLAVYIALRNNLFGLRNVK
jgi:hypothetical protein